MRLFRRGSIGISFLFFVGSIILLINITAANPTGRRYSSESPITGTNFREVGLDAERILSRDLGIPRNDDPDQRQCICNSPGARPGVGECRRCIAFTQSVGSFRRPDFVTTSYIAEVKNREGLLYTQRDQLEQIGDYAIAARALNIPLWLYVRTDSNIDPEFERLIEETGGDVVRYLTVPGYVDPIDQAASYAALISAAIIILFGTFEWFSFRRSGKTPKPPQPKRPQKPNDPASAAARKADAMEDFVNKAKDRSRRDIDEGDARDDFRE